MLFLSLAKSNSIISAIPTETVPAIIIIVSIVALTIIIERMFYYSRFKSLDPDSFRSIKDLLRQKRWDEARDVLVQNSRGPVAATLGSIIDHRRREHPHIEDELKTEAYRQIYLMEKYLTGLGTIATISPLLGVLGTVLGIMRSFSEGVGSKGAEAGIVEALVTTAMGLAVAIPAYIVYNFLVRRKEEKITEMESISEQVLPILTEK
jgi:biopolymer transport protein ExbB